MIVRYADPPPRPTLKAERRADGMLDEPVTFYALVSLLELAAEVQRRERCLWHEALQRAIQLAR